MHYRNYNASDKVSTVRPNKPSTECAALDLATQTSALGLLSAHSPKTNRGLSRTSEVRHQNCHDDAGDLFGEVTTVCRRKDLEEPRRQAPVDSQPAVTFLNRFFYPYAFQGLGNERERWPESLLVRSGGQVWEPGTQHTSELTTAIVKLCPGR
ncbi:hypothetical protein NN561_014051 [Cricetulus griseus]